MSIIFGIVGAAGYGVTDRELLSLAESTQKYAPDGTFVYSRDHIGMGFQPYHTHNRSRLECLPSVDAHGNVLSFDGRLDNHKDLCRSLDLREDETPDSRIVLKAFERWGEDSFSQLVGDWSLSLWLSSDQALYLARDHAGTRSLYFDHSNDRVVWSTYLETLFRGGRTSDLDEDFAARYLTCQPTYELTPYKNIRAVPASHFLRVRDGIAVSKPHWRWILKDSIVYKTAAQYEDHFFQLFRQSVQRRTVEGAPILAQLSGGMDSASIVCMSDYIRHAENLSTGPLDTVSFYDNSEPNWDEFPYFSAVETRRNKVGLHLDGSYSDRTIRPQSSNASLQLWPGSDSSGVDLDHRLHNALRGREVRAVLSGLGGDEVLGGVPTALPELADLMVRADLFSLARSTIDWCLASRVPFAHLLFDTFRFTLGLYFVGYSKPQTIPPWLNRRLRNLIGNSSTANTTRRRLSFALPSRISNGHGLWSALETLPNRLLSDEERFEYRYPFLDRHLVEFLFKIPRRQIVEPGRRRSLMRRALKDIVPREILERRRKAYLILGPLNLIRRERDWLSARFKRLLCAEMGLIDPSVLPNILDSIALQGDPRWWPYLMRLISLELWLESAPVSIPPIIAR